MRAFKVFTDPKAFELAADGTRRRIIHLLRARDLSVSQIADQLEMTPQAIYHHIRKMLDAGLVEVAREERIDHFIETYYRAAAEVFHFTYGDATGQESQVARTKETLRALARIGLIVQADEETVSKYTKLVTRIKSACHSPALEDRIAGIEDLDFFTKQEATELACNLAMSDKEFDELLSVQKEARQLLKSKLVESVVAQPAKA